MVRPKALTTHPYLLMNTDKGRHTRGKDEQRIIRQNGTNYLQINNHINNNHHINNHDIKCEHQTKRFD
ncbi:hypothetical protein GCM10007876_20440 [Litoribrevibacter albus]|uniref:Uncharacterized protein n=1 Tax=Litoribrevibacter albus TaxID=1473156 RepID=A0AA37SAP5_9GAMM|nr:hypothetical protein GCM10007876_20440 [Litoribrevibacter albus]